MDTQTKTIVASLFNIVVAELSEETRQRIYANLCATSPLVSEANREIYATIYDVVTAPIVESADAVIEDTPVKERSSRLHKLHIVATTPPDLETS